MERYVRILSTGTYLPRTVVPSAEIDRRLARRNGWTQRLFGIEKRHYAADDETTSGMAAAAAMDALRRACLSPGDIDCIVAACGVGEQPIPSTAVLVQNKLGLGDSGVPAFDVNSTCLSFVTAFDIVADAITLGRYRRVLVVSADIASCGLDWSNPEAAAIFGDGAAAAVLERSESGNGGRLLASHMATYGRYQDVCRLEAGGTRVNPHRDDDRFLQRTHFQMDGPAALACVVEHLPGFVDALCRRSGLPKSAIDVVIMHQASSYSLSAVRKLLGFQPERVVTIFKEFGNQIATSIPHVLHRATMTGQLERGNIAMLLGTSAGLSFGGLVIEY